MHEREREAEDALMDRNFTILHADRRIAAAGVARVLAATGVLWMKTQGFAWNAQGREGAGLGPIFAVQARDLRRASAPLADRIRALGFYAPASLSDLIALAPIEEDAGVPVAGEMARRLQIDHDAATTLIHCIRPALEDIEDTATCLVLDARLAAHESAAAALAGFRRTCPPDGLLAACVRDDLILPEPIHNGEHEGNGNGSAAN
jgi:starvation-inducible DNA-binding protein